MAEIIETIESYKRYTDALDKYYGLKAFMYDMKMTDRYKEQGVDIDFNAEAEKLERKCKKYEQIVNERKKKNAERIRDALSKAIGMLYDEDE